MRAVWTQKKSISGREKRGIAILLFRQCLVSISIAVIMLITWNRVAAISAVLGGLLVWIPNFIFAIILFLRNTYHDPKKIVNVFYVGEIIKILVTVLLLIAMLHLYTIMLAPLLVGMLSCYLVYLL